MDNSFYTCPMHPEVRRPAPGLCPECGMNLIPSQKTKGKSQKLPEHGGGDKHEGHSTKMFLRKFWVSLILTVPVVLYSGVVEKLLGWQTPDFAGSRFLPLILGSAVFFYGGWIFLAGAWRELKAHLPGMMTLIALAIMVAYLYSVWQTLAGGETLFWELTTLITIMLLGHWVEMRAVQGAQGALRELSRLLPDRAEVIRSGETVTVQLSELREGDLVLIKPGAKVPADGEILEGESELNEAMITGESQPVLKKPGSEVIAGTVNDGSGVLKARITKIGEKTFLAGIMRLVAEAQASKSRLQILSDRAAFFLTLIAVGGGLVTMAVWLSLRADFGFALERVVAVLVIACPHALGLAIPLVASISTTLAARNGFLVRQRMALESARNIEIVVFDKTGTLTKGAFGVTNIWPVVARDKTEVLQYAASLDAYSEHFIAQAVVKEAKEKGVNRLEVKDFKAIKGRGVRGLVQGKEILVGSSALAEAAGASLPENLRQEVSQEEKKGKTVIYVLAGNRILGALALADEIREESRQALRALEEMGVKTVMMTGDGEEVARWIAQELGISEYFARVSPEGKAEKVRLLQSRRLKVAMVGDGVNDAPALTRADLGIAIGAGTNVAIESAGIILVRNDPRDVVKIIRLSRASYRKMMQNLFWATGYNIVALPLAGGALAAYGIFLQPALAALFMSLSTVIVAVNAVFLRRVRL